MPQYFVVEQIVEYNPKLGDFVSEIDTRPTHLKESEALCQTLVQY